MTRAHALALALALSPVTARAEDCPDLSLRMDEAWAAYDEAELTAASALLDRAQRELSCQRRLLSPDELFALFELDALVSLGNEDDDRAVYAIIRAVTAAPERATDPDNGPALADLHATWQRRLARSTARIAVAGDFILYVDGRPVRPGTVTTVVEGAHVLQWEAAEGVHSEVRELTADQTVLTSPVSPDALPAFPDEPAAPAPRDRQPPPGTPALWGTGLGLAALGGGSVLAGFLLERRFQDAPYDAADYGGCERGTTCWETNRDAQIRQDATLLRVLYGAGYGLAGLGGALTIAGFAVQPRSDGAALVVHVRVP